jgi:hypothetical protein
LSSQQQSAHAYRASRRVIEGTATEANVGYYIRFGYRVLGEIFPLGVKMWRMLQPRPA